MTKIDDAINTLATLAAKDTTKPIESMQLAQAALNLAQARAILSTSGRK
jgi:hypothetical protein